MLRVADRQKPRRASPAAPRPDEEVEAILARVLGTDRSYARQVARVRSCQRRLQQRLDAASWQAYLRLEEAEVGRWAYACERLVVWALERQRRALERQRRALKRQRKASERRRKAR